MSSKTNCVIVFMILFVSFPCATLSQSIAGTFSGVVQGQAGPVSGAKVQITNLATGQVRFAFTDDQGRYELSKCPLVNTSSRFTSTDITSSEHGNHRVSSLA